MLGPGRPWAVGYGWQLDRSEDQPAEPAGRPGAAPAVFFGEYDCPSSQPAHARELALLSGLFHSAGVREVIGNLLVLQRLEMETKRLTAADKQTVATLRAKIPEPILAHYDRMRARGRLAVAIIRNKVCAGCHMAVPIGVLAVLMRGDDIQLCGNCGRYLYLPTESELAAPAAKPPAKRKATPIKRRKKAEPLVAAATAPAGPLSEA